MDPKTARTILNEHVQNVNLRRHCVAVAAVMRALAGKLDGDPDLWEALGYIHDADWEETKETPALHTKKTLAWLDAKNVTDPAIMHALQSHNRKLTHMAELAGPMEWALETCDELTGFIVAVTLVRPEKKLASVTVESILKKWTAKEFARAVDRTQIAQCEEKLGIPLPEFITIALTSMQEIHGELGL